MYILQVNYKNLIYKISAVYSFFFFHTPPWLSLKTIMVRNLAYFNAQRAIPAVAQLLAGPP